MSIIHVNQIKNHMRRVFDGLIDLSDASNAPIDMQETCFLSRALAAYAVHYLSGVATEIAAAAVTDGGDDNGLDAVYYDESNKRLYLVQSKWIKNGTGEPGSGDIKKFRDGVYDLFNMQFDRFNGKIRHQESLIVQALTDPGTRYEVVMIHTGSRRLARHSQRDLDDLAAEMNDTSEVVFISNLNQADVHASIVAGVAGEPITLEVGLKSWGRKEVPHDAYYGQLSGEQIAVWWSVYRTRLFARNLRGMLGDTDVNADMRQTLEQRPEDFWYFNNGITIVARRAPRAMAGGASHDFATFHCEDVSIVNGAQTVGTIGKFAETNPTAIGSVYVPVRIIIRGDNQHFGEEVTRTNNRQNRIEPRDFVAQDPEQGRIRQELAVDGIDYQLVRSESVVRGNTAFDLVEATTALACASGSVRLAVQLKREIGKLWDDLSKAPYKELFNADLPGLSVWRCVQVQRRIDRALDTRYKRGGGEQTKRHAVDTHGNRLLAALVFQALPVTRFRDPSFDVESLASETHVTALVDVRLDALVSQVERHYSNAIIPTLFKNLNKCEHLVKEAQAALSAPKPGAAVHARVARGTRRRGQRTDSSSTPM
jgi:hypothetical protein